MQNQEFKKSGNPGNQMNWRRSDMILSCVFLVEDGRMYWYNPARKARRGVFCSILVGKKHKGILTNVGAQKRAGMNAGCVCECYKGEAHKMGRAKRAGQAS